MNLHPQFLLFDGFKHCYSSFLYCIQTRQESVLQELSLLFLGENL
uniref:Uncharacterized protein n=1 Tax=Arundo donax TaxID=35708 RepID=A0A0A9AYD6_ARUDO